MNGDWSPMRASAPKLHIRPERGWLNDPNGMMFVNGRWHIFFQHNPHRARHGNIHWGHVSSGDLVSWQQHGVAFGPTPGGPDEAGCWSGAQLPWASRRSVVYSGLAIDEYDTTVCVRHALDERLENWSPPTVIASQPRGIGLTVMRDPAPFEWQGRRFALMGAGLQDGTAAVLLFSCEDDHAWEFRRIWLTAHDLAGYGLPKADIWECPQLLQFPDRALLFFSLQHAGRLKGVGYLVGGLASDPRWPDVPAFVPKAYGSLDRGPDFYAPQAIWDGHPEPLLVGWIRQTDEPTTAPADTVAGCLTFPRRLSLVGDRVAIGRDSSLEKLCGGALSVPLAARATELALPPRAALSVTGDGRAPLRIELVGTAGPHEVEIGGSQCEIWVDGEVAEIFVPGDVACTIRQADTEHWRVRGLPGNGHVRPLALSRTGHGGRGCDVTPAAGAATG